MTSLKGFLPPAGSALWRKDRGRLSSESEGTFSSPAIKHVVIREVWQKGFPSPHALYKIDVMTKSNHWFVFRRYREFSDLHKKLVNLYGIPKDMLPPKKFTSKMALSHLERRKEALEHYLQRLVNSSTYVSSSPEIVEFLEVQRHDVMSVTKALAKNLSKNGEAMLARGESLTLTPTQLYCISRQLQLPEPSYPLDDVEATDLGNLYDFIYQLKALCVSSIANSSSTSQELASHLEFDVSLFKALTCLIIDGCPLTLINELSKIQAQLTKLTARYCLTTMKELLVECAAEKRSAPKVKGPVDSWRGVTTTRLTQNRVVVQPWHQLAHLNLTHNKLAVFDTSLKLLPVLQSLDMSHNEFVHLDLQQLCCPSLNYLNLSHNNIHFITGAARELAHLKSLILSHNNLETGSGLDCLAGLIELDISSNQFRVVHEISKLCLISHMKYLSVAGNPFARVKPYRVLVLSYFKGRDVVLDKRPITQKERVKLRSYPTKLRASSTPGYILSDGDEGEEHHVVAPRSYSFDLFGPLESDDDSGIEGASSLRSNSEVIEPHNGAAMCVDNDLNFSWSYYGLGNDLANDDLSSEANENSPMERVSVSGLHNEGKVFGTVPQESVVGHLQSNYTGEGVVRCESTVQQESSSTSSEEEEDEDSEWYDATTPSSGQYVLPELTGCPDHCVVGPSIDPLVDPEELGTMILKGSRGSSQGDITGGSDAKLQSSLQESTLTDTRTESCEQSDSRKASSEGQVIFTESTSCTDNNPEERLL